MTLRFYLLRHAEAEPHTIQKEDKDRALSARGRTQTQKMGEWLADNIIPTVNGGDKGGEAISTNSEASPLNPPTNGGNRFHFDIVYCSAAVRTKETLALVLASSGTQSVSLDAIHYEPQLYHASAEKMLQILHTTPSNCISALMVGHNPGISELAMRLARRGDTQAIHDLGLGYPTCALTIFEFDCGTWQEVCEENSQLMNLVIV